MPAAASPVPSPLAPNLRDHFFRGMQAGMQGGPAMQGGAGIQDVAGQGAPGGNSGVRPQPFGPPVDGQALVFPQRGLGRPVPDGPPVFDKAESVKIIVSRPQQDGNELIKRLAKSLQCNNYSSSGSNDKLTMQLKYSGELDVVVKLIDFGKVTLIDSPERTIHVAGQ